MDRLYRVVTGPTASGKTAALLRLATTRPMVAVSADSRQVYQFMDIGTGKPAPVEQSILFHKVIDIVSPLDKFNAHYFLKLAATALEEAYEQGSEPWVVGGTGLYIRALVENLGLGVAPRPKLRAALAKLLADKSAVEVSRMFSVSTPDDSNPVRVARLIENACRDRGKAMQVYQIAGIDVEALDSDSADVSSSIKDDTKDKLSKWRCGAIAVLDPGREELAHNIGMRVAGMFQRGLIEEVEKLRELGFGSAPVVKDGIGYREAGQVLDGKLDKQQAIGLTVVRTKQYAKRQRTYFKKLGWGVIHPADFEDWVSKLEKGR